MTTQFNVIWGSGKETTLETSETSTPEAYAMERWGRTLEEVEALGVKIELASDAPPAEQPAAPSAPLSASTESSPLPSAPSQPGESMDSHHNPLSTGE